jgi:hypothetical protein
MSKQFDDHLLAAYREGARVVYRQTDGAPIEGPELESRMAALLAELKPPPLC